MDVEMDTNPNTEKGELAAPLALHPRMAFRPHEVEYLHVYLPVFLPDEDEEDEEDEDQALGGGQGPAPAMANGEWRGRGRVKLIVKMQQFHLPFLGWWFTKRGSGD